MSQQTNVGFKAPGFSVVADEPVGASPDGTNFTSAESFGSPRLLNFPAVLFTESSATGVCHRAASACALIDTSPAELPASLLPFFAGASDVGVAHSAAAVTAARSGPWFRAASLIAPSVDRTPLSASEAVGVGHKPESIPAMGRVDGTSWDNDRPAGVVLCFQVSRHSVEPVLANRRRNLFSHDDSGPAGTDEAKEVGPQVPIVILGFSLTRD